MHLDKTVSHRLRTLVACAKRNEGYTKVAQLRRDPGLTEAHMNKIVGSLVDLGLVETKQGVHGGVRLAPGVATQPLGQVVARLVGKTLSLAPHGQAKPSATRNVDLALAAGFAAFLTHLDQHTIHDLAVPRDRSRP